MHTDATPTSLLFERQGLRGLVDAIDFAKHDYSGVLTEGETADAARDVDALWATLRVRVLANPDPQMAMLVLLVHAWMALWRAQFTHATRDAAPREAAPRKAARRARGASVAAAR